MTEQVDTPTQPQVRPDGINVSDAAASKVKSLLEQEGRDDPSSGSPSSPVAAPVCATSCSSTSGTSTATWSPTSTASPWSSTG